MRIGIDARLLQTAHRTRGIGSYIYNLIRNIANVDSENQYLLFILKNAKPIKLDIVNSGFQKEEYRVYRPPRPERLYWFWDYLFLSKAISRSKVGLFHATDLYSVPFCHSCKVIATVYDLIPLIFPKDYLGFKRLNTQYAYYKCLEAVKRTDKILTISKHSKSDIGRTLNVPEEKVKVIYLAADERFRPISDKEILRAVKTKYNISRRFILHVGGFDPRKNVQRLIKAFATVEKNSSQNYQLVIAGKMRRRIGRRLAKMVGSFNLGGKVIFTGFVEDRDLPALYGAADLFVFPSLYEGFGLPPLEAMACGIPVVSSNTSSLPEVVRDAALLVDPYDVDEIAEAMYKVLNDAELRETMRRKGLDRAKMFSWEKTARETLAVYKEVAGD